MKMCIDFECLLTCSAGGRTINNSLTLWVSVERPPDLPRISQVIGAQTLPETPDPIECKGPDIKDCKLFHIYCLIHSMSARCLWWEISENCCLINCLATNWHTPPNKPENIEEFCQSASGKPDP